MNVRFLIALSLVLSSLALAQADGTKLFQQNCTACHQTDAKGTPEVIPPLANHLGHFVKAPEGRGYLVGVIAFGIRGALTAGGLKYNDVMPAFAFLTDEELAAMLNHILTTYNKELLPQDFKPFTAAEIKQLRTTRISAADLLKRREALVKQLDIK